jgi:hypothetical protein
VNNLVSKIVAYRERQFFKLGPNDGIDPYVDTVAAKCFIIHYGTKERKLSNVAGSTEGEDSVHKKCKLCKHFKRCVVVVIEVEDLTILPEMAPSTRNKTLTNSCFDWEK